MRISDCFLFLMYREIVGVSIAQSFHNYVFYQGGFDKVKAMSAGYAEVINMGYIAKIKTPERLHTTEDFIFLDNGRLIVKNLDGSPAPVSNVTAISCCVRTFVAKKNILYGSHVASF